MYSRQRGCGTFLWVGAHESGSFAGMLPKSASDVSDLLVISTDNQNQLCANMSQSSPFMCLDYKLCYAIIVLFLMSYKHLGLILNRTGKSSEVLLPC